MKRQDIALIGFVIFFSAVISLIISNAIFASPKKRQQQASTVQPITTDFPTPDPHYFNQSAYDPTQPLDIGQNGNTDPFKSISH
ncbi:MAG TPA: hypothetical protein VG604_00985 [Candidatus Saccharimonadales bacterium]|nr:hypothetical protein [Candidatus Saccharimonadales bacterium]